MPWRKVWGSTTKRRCRTRYVEELHPAELLKTKEERTCCGMTGATWTGWHGIKSILCGKHNCSCVCSLWTAAEGCLHLLINETIKWDLQWRWKLFSGCRCLCSEQSTKLHIEFSLLRRGVKHCRPFRRVGTDTDRRPRLLPSLILSLVSGSSPTCRRCINCMLRPLLPSTEFGNLWLTSFEHLRHSINKTWDVCEDQMGWQLHVHQIRQDLRFYSRLFLFSSWFTFHFYVLWIFVLEFCSVSPSTLTWSSFVTPCL